MRKYFSLLFIAIMVVACQDSVNSKDRLVGKWQVDSSSFAAAQGGAGASNFSGDVIYEFLPNGEGMLLTEISLAQELEEDVVLYMDVALTQNLSWTCSEDKLNLNYQDPNIKLNNVRIVPSTPETAAAIEQLKPMLEQQLAQEMNAEAFQCAEEMAFDFEDDDNVVFKDTKLGSEVVMTRL